MKFKSLRQSSVILGLLCALLPQAHAQTPVWPTKPVKIVVTFPPGGAPDTLARVLADKWGQATGQTFTVDNKPGGAAISAPTLSPKAQATAPRC